MNTLPDLASLEHRAFRSFHQDGLLDLLVGGIMVITPLHGIITAFGYVASIVVLLCLFWAAKRCITAPRIGTVQFGERRWSRSLVLVFILGLSGGLTTFAMTLVVSYQNGKLPDMGWFLANPTLVGAMFAGQMLVVFSIVAWLLEFPRAVLIGALFAVGVMVSMEIDNPSAMAYAGLVLIATGGTYLARFIRRYPLVRIPVLGDSRDSK